MPAGAPPFFNTPQDMQVLIDDYFLNGVTVKNLIINKIPVSVPVPTITGLCIHLGFESRQSFYDYESKPEFAYTVKKARLFIEKEYEEQLQIGNTAGAIFALKNFGWTDKQEIDQKTEHSGGITIKFEEPDLQHPEDKGGD